VRPRLILSSSVVRRHSSSRFHFSLSLDFVVCHFCHSFMFAGSFSSLSSEGSPFDCFTAPVPSRPRSTSVSDSLFPSVSPVFTPASTPSLSRSPSPFDDSDSASSPSRLSTSILFRFPSDEEFNSDVPFSLSVSSFDWSGLVKDLICVIFSSLDLTDLLSCRRTCSSWNRATHSPLSWQSTWYQFDGGDDETQFRHSIESKLPSLRFIRNLTVIQREIPLSLFLSYFNPHFLPQLTSFHLCLDEFHTEQIRMIGTFPKLQKLRIGRGSRIESFGGEGNVQSNLISPPNEEKDVEGMSHVTSNGMIPLLSSLPSLSELVFLNCHDLLSSEFRFLPLSLTSLDVSYGDIDTAGWNRIGAMSLIKLSIRPSSSFLPSASRSRLFAGLVELSKSHCASTLQQMIVGGQLPCCSSDLPVDDSNSTPHWFSDLLPFFPNLIHLDLDWAEATYSEWMKLIDSIRRRREMNPSQPFELSNCWKVSLLPERSAPRWFDHQLFGVLFVTEYFDEQLGDTSTHSKDDARSSSSSSEFGINCESDYFRPEISSSRRSPHWRPFFSLMKRMIRSNWNESGPMESESGCPIQCPCCGVKFNQHHISICSSFG